MIDLTGTLTQNALATSPVSNLDKFGNALASWPLNYKLYV